MPAQASQCREPFVSSDPETWSYDVFLAQYLSLLCFDVGIDAFAPACGGSLRREGKNHWVAEFEFEPMKKVLPCPGRHTFFLGGRLEGGPAFAGRIVAEVKA